MRFILLEEVQENSVGSKRGKFLVHSYEVMTQGAGRGGSNFIPGMSCMMPFEKPLEGQFIALPEGREMGP